MLQRRMAIPQRAAKPLPLWTVTAGPFKGDTAPGRDKSEARAALKRRYGLPKLPAGTTLEKTQEAPCSPS